MQIVKDKSHLTFNDSLHPFRIPFRKSILRHIHGLISTKYDKEDQRCFMHKYCHAVHYMRGQFLTELSHTTEKL